MENERNERRAKMLEKVRKLLAMARDGRGNENEEAIAMRHANKIMAEYGIAEAECDMSVLDAGKMVFGEVFAGMDGRAPEPGKVHKSYSTWVGVLAVGVARFTDSIVGRSLTGNGQMLVFRGEREDVLLARWLLGVLTESLQREQKASGWTSRADAGSFRMSAASTLSWRLRDLANERRAMYETAKRESNSRALVVIDRKALEIVKRFGTQKTRTNRAGYSSSAAAIAGQEAGRRINIPAGRPIGDQSRTMLN